MANSHLSILIAAIATMYGVKSTAETFEDAVDELLKYAAAEKNGDRKPTVTEIEVTPREQHVARVNKILALAGNPAPRWCENNSRQLDAMIFDKVTVFGWDRETYKDLRCNGTFNFLLQSLEAHGTPAGTLQLPVQFPDGTWGRVARGFAAL
jgi:hypothetical protein